MSTEKYKLKDGVTIFYDDESELKVVTGKTVEIDEDEATPKTAQAILSGALVKVKTPKEQKTDK